MSATGEGGFMGSIRDEFGVGSPNDKVDKVRGMTVCINTTAKTDAEGRALLRAMGMPFRS